MTYNLQLILFLGEKRVKEWRNRHCLSQSSCYASPKAWTTNGSISLLSPIFLVSSCDICEAEPMRACVFFLYLWLQGSYILLLARTLHFTTHWHFYLISTPGMQILCLLFHYRYLSFCRFQVSCFSLWPLIYNQL